MDLLDVCNKVLLTPIEELSPEDKEEVFVARAGAKALRSISQSRKNCVAMRKAGFVKLIARLLKSIHGDVIISIMGTLQKCAAEVSMTFHCFVLYSINGVVIAAQCTATF